MLAAGSIPSEIVKNLRQKQKEIAIFRLFHVEDGACNLIERYECFGDPMIHLLLSRSRPIASTGKT